MSFETLFFAPWGDSPLWGFVSDLLGLQELVDKWKTGRTRARPGSNVCLFLTVTPPTYAGPRVCPLRGQGSICALTTGVRAVGKPGAPSWGPVAVSMLISSVTFKLPGRGRDGGWSREASPGLLGKNFLRRGPGQGRRAAGLALRPGD